MREIKFRTWEKKNKKWIMDDCPIVLYGDGSGHILIEVDHVHGNETIFLEDVELMQFIGLKDKNGKEIYEGDIVNYNSKYIKSSNKEEFNRMLVVFLNGGYYLESKNKAHFHFGIVSKEGDLEVIGNIYENPELLEDKE